MACEVGISVGCSSKTLFLFSNSQFLLPSTMERHFFLLENERVAQKVFDEMSDKRKKMENLSGGLKKWFPFFFFFVDSINGRALR
ncbi:hypothetical protein IC575_004115 [Cucumis melo]